MRVLDSNGRIKVVTDDLVVVAPAQLTAFGELLATDLHPVAGWNNSIVNHPDLVSTTVTANATITNSGGMAVVAVSGGSGVATATFNTKRTLRYVPGIGGLCRFTAIWPSGGVANITQFVGILNSSDGFAFGYNGTSFGILRRVGGVDNFVAQASWSEAALFTPDFTKLNVFQIRYQWLGGGMITFYMENPATGSFVLIHKIAYANTAAVSSINNPTLPITAIVARSSGSGATSIRTPSAMSFREGDVFNALRTRNAVRNSVSVGAETVLFSIRVKSSVFGGATNRGPITPDFISIASDGAKSAQFFLYKNGTLTGGTWADISTTRSIVERNLTNTIGSGILIATIEMDKVGSNTIDLHALDIYLDVDESLTVTASSAASNDAECGVSWEELN